MKGRILRLEKSTMVRLLHDKPAFSERFVAHLLARAIRVEEDLVELFDSSEKRLARALLLLANFGKEGKPEPIIAKVSLTSPQHGRLWQTDGSCIRLRPEHTMSTLPPPRNRESQTLNPPKIFMGLEHS